MRDSILLKVTIVCGVLLAITAAPLVWGQPPLAWFGVVRIAFSISLFAFLVQLIRYLAGETLWLLRNRLILAYVFMGVVPVVLIAAMLAIGAYMFYGQYAAYLLLTDINQHTQNVGAVNTLTVRELDRHPDRAAEVPELSDYYASYYFPRGFGGVHSYFFGPAGVASTPLPRRLGSVPAWLKHGFLGLIYFPGGYAIASYRSTSSLPARILDQGKLPTGPAASPHLAAGEQREDVLTLYGIGVRNLDTLAQSLGTVTLGSRFVNLPNAAAGADFNPEQAPRLSSSPALRPAHSIFDIKITSWAFLPVTNWETGEEHTVLATISSRPTLLNDQLFASLPSENSETASRLPLYLLAAIGVGFLIIEAFSLVAGVRLTKTITGAVNDLYTSTEHVNRGDFDHRIPVRNRDQLAALEIAFNNMIASIGRLLKEQRQKQQLESEITIAREVQTQLFPRTPPQVAGLEIAGRCLAARTVSGDYYDFAQLSPGHLSITLGDVSGKGISAALLMATIVAAVRAFQPSLADVAVGALAGVGYDGVATDTGEPSPAHLLNRLNRQLFHSTPPEKYATMFYALYDAGRHELRYTNAGHLPPAVLGSRGVRRLDRGGMVVGLFEDVMFDQGTVELEHGELLAAWSDGITEPENAYGVEFGEERLLRLLEERRRQPLPEIIEAVLRAVREWTGAAEQSDDITLVLARVDPDAHSRANAR